MDWQYKLVDERVLFFLDEKVDWENTYSVYDPRESFEFTQDNIEGENWKILKERVKYGLTHAPEDTRDYFASKVLRKFPNKIRDISWGRIEFKNATVILSEPYMLTKDEIGEEIENSTSVNSLLSKIKKLYPNNVLG